MIVTSSPSPPPWRLSRQCSKPLRRGSHELAVDGWQLADRPLPTVNCQLPTSPMPRRRKSNLQQRLEYAAYRAAARALRAASDGAVVRWGTRVGMLARHVLRGRDRLAMRNLAMVFPDKSERERRRILDDCWRHFGRETLDGIRTQYLSAEEIAARCSMNGIEVLDAALARGRGVLLISGHYGGWEVGGLAIMSRIRHVLTVARPLDNEYLERDLARIRERSGTEVVDRRGAARSLYKALSDNAVVILLV